MAEDGSGPWPEVEVARQPLPTVDGLFRAPVVVDGIASGMLAALPLTADGSGLFPLLEAGGEWAPLGKELEGVQPDGDGGIVTALGDVGTAAVVGIRSAPPVK